ncbi:MULTISPECIES: type I restriction-modification system endonuclease [unclassified Pseudomonas]|uniref:type I restriction-modification system endonuclease n=1 Tax=unclassified Pseudomonas TaxID=196821 RepID=UPI000C87C8BF|nr:MULTISPECIES: type I restriction-modification system endonuclease [unclassified Pseudomonas]PMU10196.1 type I restriction-modification system endonuclease [Pseudomonas sp. FW305-20]PMU19062.1 type I restriction-modification system endonuclease [Pseudomonas sp. FW305-122]PMU42376.1 type I restriction-modification system endonuclease [Pseudomonas sp. FW305-47B]PMX62766.1 type I restriction-modification system endonuclease [Pseudomonas sp. FW305-33]PMX68029.1 type I restriction-modification sy
MAASSNFSFLQEHDPVFLQLASAAEQVFGRDPNTTLIKLRQLGEALAQDLASRAGIEFDATTTQSDLLYKLSRDIQLDQNIRSLFHTLRIEGNKATHQFRTQHREAMDGLKVARALAIWYHQSFGKNGNAFKPGAFVTPADPSTPLRDLQNQIKQLKVQLSESSQQLESNQQLALLMRREAEEYSVLAEQMDAESRKHKQLADSHEAELNKLRAEFEQRLMALQKRLETKPQSTKQVVYKTQQASSRFDLSEDLTRILIDQQLIEAGWEADSLDLIYSKGARPEKGKNKAIAEWPTSSPKACADYVLFAGLLPVAIVEAKRKRINIADRITQAERYAREFEIPSEYQQSWLLAGRPQPWNDGQGNSFRVPFAFACNGRPYIKQLAEQSGTWFRDLRSPANTRRPLQDFHTPNNLLDLLRRSQAEAEAKLKGEGFAYLKLRDYQEKAIQAVEQALANNHRNCLLAMATGTGKTRTIIGLMYRFLKAERFKRILFLVDRSALGQQAIDSFNDTPLEQNHTLAQIYDIKELGDMAAEAETRIQVATVQAMVSRVFRSDSPPSVGEFDCIIVDEAHRGYTLDQEMSEGELAVRDHSQYLSQYRRVLDYFDACKIGLTATPAKHTSEIFGKPVFTYSYREAVADDWLIDHEPPIRYETRLSKHGIRFEKGESVSVINTQTGEVDLAELEDELTFNIESFNRRVITPAFDKVICDALANELDPFGEEKTMIFCVNQAHAERVKNLLDDAFREAYGEQYNQATVQIITGQSDKVEQLIRKYKNETHPSIAITVDLLTTGIDVPKICNLVFMRRVRSRILYEQMKGRATRRCDDIGKTVFRIYDPVDLYASLEAVDTMKPLVKNPNVSLEQLVSELTNDASHDAPGTQEDSSHAHDVLDVLSQRIMRILRTADHKAESDPSLKKKLNELEDIWGVEPAKLHKHLHELGPQQAANFIRQHSQLINQLDTVSNLLGSERHPIIATQSDELIGREQNYGDHQKPQDYLESFHDFIHQQLNQSAALGVVVNRPKDLTREQLRNVRLLLDQHGFSEVSLKSAWRNQTNQEIAASIIGYIRQAAIGEALLPFDQRVATAMQKIYALQQWTHVQRKWLDRLARQLVHEVIIDLQQVNEAFKNDGGLKSLNRNLGGHLDRVLEVLNDNLWPKVG